MSNRSNIIQVFEHSTLKVDSDGFKQSHFDALETYGYKNKEKYYTVGNKRIKFSNYVGVIQVKNLTIEILPKADKSEDNAASKTKWHEALLKILHECKFIKLDSLTNAALKIKSASILDLYFDAYLTECERIVREGLDKSYRKIAENANKVKGKIIFAENIRRNFIHKERVFVEYKVYDIDNRLNQTLRKGLEILSSLSNKTSFVNRINRLLLDFEKVSSVKISSPWFDTLKYDRSTQHYLYAITLAKLIILRYSPDLKGGKENVLAIMFDMNVLYENYIYRKLKVLEHNADIPITKVKGQNRLSFWESRGIRADIVLESKVGNFVIDTKWKVINSNNPADDDLKQMFVYNLHYDSDLSILLYPQTNMQTNEKKPFVHRDFQNRNCQVAFADLFKDGMLDKNLGLTLYDQLLKPEIQAQLVAPS